LLRSPHWKQIEFCRTELSLDPFRLFTVPTAEMPHVYIWRRDLIAQVVSGMIAARTKIYHRRVGRPNVPSEELADAESEAPAYDFAFALPYLLELVEFENGWAGHFARHGIRPHVVVYEDLCRDLTGVVGGV
jgi:LPS sulfotransferase NodH